MPAGCFLEMSVDVNPAHGVVAYVAVQIQRLRISEDSIRYRSGPGCPIRHQETADGVAVVACSEVITTSLGVGFFAGENVVIVEVGDNYALAAIGIEVLFSLDDAAAAIGGYVCRAKVVAEVVVHSAAGIYAGAAFAAEENIFIAQNAVEIGL